jgi:hypothetical protein
MARLRQLRHRFVAGILPTLVAVAELQAVSSLTNTGANSGLKDLIMAPVFRHEWLEGGNRDALNYC